MNLSQADIDLIAEQLPPPDSGDGRIADIARQLRDDRAGRLFAAAANLQYRTYRRMAWPPLPGFRGAASVLPLPPRAREMSFGFIPLGAALAREMPGPFPRSENFAFGVSVREEHRGDERAQSVIGRIGYGGRSFPIVTTAARLTPEAVPPNPGSPTTVGSSACWARSRSPGGWQYGVLTARHVVEHLSIGTIVNLDATGYAAPATGELADLGHCAIDAAIIAIDSGDWPSGLSPLALCGPFKSATPPLAPGDDVVLDGRFTKTVTHKLLSHHPLPGYWGSLMGQRLVMDGTGRGGDSGALVTKKSGGGGIGIYMGRIDDGAGGKNGLCQDLYQASVYLDADLFL